MCVCLCVCVYVCVCVSKQQKRSRNINLSTQSFTQNMFTIFSLTLFNVVTLKVTV